MSKYKVVTDNTKKCSKCSELKDLSKFSKNKNKSDKLNSICKSCAIRYAKEYRRSYTGSIAELYHHQTIKSKQRGHPRPKYNLEQLRVWCLSQPKFYELFDNWVESEYNKMKTPSIDRKDDHKPYEWGNIQLMTWAENKGKGHHNSQIGLISTGNPFRSVIQLTKDGKFITEHISTREASRCVNASQANLWRSCNDKRKSTKGYRWMFKDDYGSNGL